MGPHTTAGDAKPQRTRIRLNHWKFNVTATLSCREKSETAQGPPDSVNVRSYIMCQRFNGCIKASRLGQITNSISWKFVGYLHPVFDTLSIVYPLAHLVES